eukprot:6230444-Alexandrium_andersonii.AAC.1
MSASLVGSEMCIRDSFGDEARAAKRDWRRGADCHGDGRKPGQAESARPVSYTHLTLPTICSV